MSSLGLSLLILIVLAIASLAGYNYWVNRKSGGARRTETDWSDSSAGNRSQRQEPSFSGDDETRPTQSGSPPVSQAVAEAPSPSPAVVNDWRQAGSTTGTTEPSDAPASGASNPPPSVDWQSGSGQARVTSEPEPTQGLDWREAAQFDPTAAELEEAARSPSESELSEQLAGEIEKTLAEVESASGEALPVEAEMPADQADEATPVAEPPVQSEQPVAPADQIDETVAPATVAPAVEQQSPPEPEPPQPERLPEENADTEPAERDWTGVDLERSSGKFFAGVTLELGRQIPGAELSELTAGISRAGSKPITVSAANPEDVIGGELRSQKIDPSKAYSIVRFELLQVNRQGPVDGVEYSEFVNTVSEISEKLDVLADAPDMNVVLIRSRVLDAEIASLDAQVAVNVEAEEPIDPTRFAEVAAEQQLQSGNNSHYNNVNEQGWLINTVELDQNANRIVMILDVPTIPREQQPIRQMVECAWKFAQAFDGKMIDDSGRLIDNPLFERIESQLEIHYQALMAAGVPAGSDLARQVYNTD